MRFWQAGPVTFGQSDDDVDFTALDPAGGWVELADLAAYEAATAAAATGVSAPPVATSVNGNGQSHSTDPSARRVTVHVVAPIGGPLRARPTVDGVPVVGGSGPLVFDYPGHAIEVATRAGNNDVMVIEEF